MNEIILMSILFLSIIDNSKKWNDWLFNVGLIVSLILKVFNELDISLLVMSFSIFMQVFKREENIKAIILKGIKTILVLGFLITSSHQMKVTAGLGVVIAAAAIVSYFSKNIYHSLSYALAVVHIFKIIENEIFLGISFLFLILGYIRKIKLIEKYHESLGIILALGILNEDISMNAPLLAIYLGCGILILKMINYKEEGVL